MSGKRHRQKGDRFEREMVNVLQEQGIGAERQPLSGSLGGKFDKDLTVPVQGLDWKAECKHYADGRGFTMLYDWIWGARLLFLKKDRHRTLVVMSLEDFAALAKLPAETVSSQEKDAA